MMWFVGHRPISPSGESLLALPKSNQKASPCTPLHPPVLATGGMRQRHTKASLALRTVCADDASTTARCSAPRRGLKGGQNRKKSGQDFSSSQRLIAIAPACRDNVRRPHFVSRNFRNQAVSDVCE